MRLVVLVLAVFPMVTWAAESALPASTELSVDVSVGALAAKEFSKATGVAMTPLLGLSLVGAGKWYATESVARPRLPFHQQPWFFGTGLGLVVMLFFGHRLPVIKRGFKVVKAWENKLSGLLAMPILGSSIATALTRPATVAVSEVGHWLVPTAWAASGEVTGDGAAQLGSFVAWFVSLVLMAATWLAAHTVNVLSLISPVAPVDWVLKGTKNLFVGVLAGAAAVNPWAGLVVSVVYVLVSLVVAGWAFRLTVFGVVFTTDLLLLRSRRERVEVGALRCFSTAALPGVPSRSWGQVVPTEQGLGFSYRPWLVFRRRVVQLGAAQGFAVEKGLVSPVLLSVDPGAVTMALVRFPPRFRPHATDLALALGGVPVLDPPVLRGFAAARVWLAEQFRRSTSAFRHAR